MMKISTKELEVQMLFVNRVKVLLSILTTLMLIVLIFHVRLGTTWFAWTGEFCFAVGYVVRWLMGGEFDTGKDKGGCLSDEEIETLMELSKELQTQTNDGTAFPYYWEPSSLKREYNIRNEEGEFYVINDEDRGMTYGNYQELAEEHEDLYQKFLDQRYGEGPDYHDGEYRDEVEAEWIDYVLNESNLILHEYGYDLNRKSEHNMSLFRSDVKRFCQANKHHLGSEPAPYAYTTWRMPKMKELVKILCKLNPQPEQDMDPECRSALSR